ncbi:helix-hairpin-helix domain-containing protein [Runella sp.]|jgi:competence ComEA-like helix-hairpin-helix protein|uniref:ComEA family DNA-binding protein n=1 Tax=Runella sp. TaxID=1960881 RepID=UPI00262146A4|nr:helix-hairpin-helix domain-containing protein [Runella sp.]
MFQRLLFVIRDEFGLSRSQARGFLALAVLMMLCWFGPLAYDRFFNQTPKTVSQSDARTADSLLAILEKIQPEKPVYGKSYERTYPSKEVDNPERPLSLFYFDPNLASSEQFQELGMPKFIAARIIKYRSKGGQFRKKEDLQKIYGLQASLYERLEPYINIPEKQAVASISPTQPTANTSLPPTPVKPAYTKPVVTTFDINTADTTQLIRLKGIGSKLAARIVKFRDGLGGFASTTQYSEVFGLDSLALSELNHFAQIRTTVHKISINTVSPEELDRHPYLSKRQSEIIVRYREQHGAYKTAQDLLNIKILDEKLVNKIAPYLAF